MNETQDTAGESDFLAERPENWYKGPLIFPSFPQEGAEMETAQPYRAEAVGFFEESWSD